MGQLAAQDAADQMERWRSTLLDRAVFVVDADDQYHEEAALSLQERHSIYDCVYLVPSGFGFRWPRPMGYRAGTGYWN